VRLHCVIPVLEIRELLSWPANQVGKLLERITNQFALLFDQQTELLADSLLHLGALPRFKAFSQVVVACGHLKLFQESVVAVVGAWRLLVPDYLQQGY
jgi:hypothetical protein